MRTPCVSMAPAGAAVPDVGETARGNLDSPRWRRPAWGGPGGGGPSRVGRGDRLGRPDGPAARGPRERVRQSRGSIHGLRLLYPVETIAGTLTAEARAAARRRRLVGSVGGARGRVVGPLRVRHRPDQRGGHRPTTMINTLKPAPFLPGTRLRAHDPATLPARTPAAPVLVASSMVPARGDDAAPLGAAYVPFINARRPLARGAFRM